MLIFLAYPYWAGMITAQWIPLIMASAFFSWLTPVALAKPQIGLPVAVTRSGRLGAVTCVVVIVLSVAVMPHWLALWLIQTRNYVHFVPLLLLPGPLLALALIRYRNRDSWLLFLSACMPQRWFYDSFFLWLIPATRRQIVFTVGLSWIPGIWRWYHSPHTITEVGRLTVLCFYLPMLVVLLWKTRQEAPRSTAAQSKTDSGAKVEASRASTAE
jgi:hypothetical protein